MQRLTEAAHVLVYITLSSFLMQLSPVIFVALCSLFHLHLISPNGVLTFCSSKEKYCQTAANGDQDRLLFWVLSRSVQPAILPLSVGAI